MELNESLMKNNRMINEYIRIENLRDRYITNEIDDYNFLITTKKEGDEDSNNNKIAMR